jgi:CRP-like cAMP-binding protein
MEAANVFWKNIFRKSVRDSSIKSLLKQTPLFSNLTHGELEKVESIVHSRTYSDQELIFRQGDVGVGMYVVKSGMVDIVHNVGGVSRKLAHLEADDFFGEIALLDEAPRSASAIACGPTEVIGFFRPDLLDLVERAPRLGIKILLNLAQLVAIRLREVNEALTAVTHSDETAEHGENI